METYKKHPGMSQTHENGPMIEFPAARFWRRFIITGIIYVLSTSFPFALLLYVVLEAKSLSNVLILSSPIAIVSIIHAWEKNKMLLIGVRIIDDVIEMKYFKYNYTHNVRYLASSFKLRYFEDKTLGVGFHGMNKSRVVFTQYIFMYWRRRQYDRLSEFLREFEK